MTICSKLRTSKGVIDGCGKEFSGRVHHCTVCHETFGGEEGFMRHQLPLSKYTKCQSPDKIGMHQDTNGTWIRSYLG